MHEFEKKGYLLVAKFGPLVARILIGGMFVMAGVSKLTNVAGTAGYIASVGLPAATLLAWLAIAIEIIAGLGVLLGYRARYSADILVLFTLVTIFFFHNFWAFEGDAAMTQMIMFQKNFAIIGGLLYIMAYGSGPFSLGNRQKVPPKEEYSAEN